MAILNAFDLLGEDDCDEPSKLFELAEQKGKEIGKANAISNQIAKFASLRAAAEREDKSREEAKVRADKERKKANFLQKKKEREEREKQELANGSDSGSVTGAGESVSNGVKPFANNGNSYGDDKPKEKKNRRNGKFFDEVEKPRLPPIPVRRTIQFDLPTVTNYVSLGGSSERPSSRQSSRQSDRESDSGDYQRLSDVHSDGAITPENGNEIAGQDYQQPPVRRQSRPMNKNNFKANVDEAFTLKPEVIAELEAEPKSESEPTVVVPEEVEKNDVDSDLEKQKEAEENQITFAEYQKQLDEKKKNLAKTKEERKVEVDKELQKMKPLSAKKENNEVFVKLGSDKESAKKKGNPNRRDEKPAPKINASDLIRFPKYVRPRPTFNNEGNSGPSFENQGNGRIEAQQSQAGYGRQTNSTNSLSNGSEGGSGRGDYLRSNGNRPQSNGGGYRAQKFQPAPKSKAPPALESDLFPPLK
ncbi:hypothetical protein ACHQM5_020235 [Ranunculus cassubicifolius]